MKHAPKSYLAQHSWILNVVQTGKQEYKLSFTFIVLTILISLGFRVFKADIAASSAGKASARSPSHSSLISLATLAASFAIASSAETTWMRMRELWLKACHH